MIGAQTIHIAILFVGVGLTAGLAVVAGRRRQVPGAQEFGSLMIAVAWWALMEAAQVLAPTIPAKLTYAKLSYLGIEPVAVLYVLFAWRQCVPERPLTRKRIFSLCILPLITIGAVFTNEWHWLFYTQITLDDTLVGTLPIYHHGPLFWLNVVYTYLLILSGTILLFTAFVHAPRRRRAQLGVLVIGSAITWLGNAIYVFNLISITGLDLTPMTFTLTGLVYGWALFRLGLLQLTPAARQMLVEKMRDGVLVLDAEERVVDLNPAARRLLKRMTPVIGAPVRALLIDWTQPDGHPLDLSQSTDQIIVTSDGAQALELRISRLVDRQGEHVGWLVILRDVTEQRQAEASLRESQRAFATLLSNLPGMAYRCQNDPNWTVQFVSQGCVALTGYQPADLEQNRRIAYAALIHEADREMVWNQVQAAVQSHSSFQLTYRIRAADGTEKWVWEQGRGVYGQDGNLVALEGFIIDFTERVRAIRAEQEQRELAEALYEATVALNRTLDLDEVLDRILAQLGRVVSYDAAVIYLIHGDQARPVRWRGTDAQTASLAHQNWRISDTPNMRAMVQMRQSVVVPDTHADPTWIILPETDWVASHAGAPICARDAVLGFLEVDSARSGFYRPQDSERLRVFADQAALALQNASSFEETRRHAEQMAMLNRIGLAITAGLSMEQTLRTIYEQCLQIASLDGFYVALYDSITGDIHFPLFLDSDQVIAMQRYNLRTRPGLAGAVIAQAQTLYLSDTLDEQAAATYQITYVGSVTRTYLGIPLTVREQVIGVLSVQNTQAAAFTPEQIRLFEMVATQAAIAIDNAQLYEMAQSEKQYLEALVDHNLSGIVVIDPEGRVKRWNPAAERIFGYAKAEALGHNIDSLIACGSPQMLREGTRLTATAFSGQLVAHIVTRRQRKDGSLVDVEIYGAPEVTETQRGMILSYYDISELQATRKAIEQSNLELQQRLAELDRANADLQAHNEELDAFAHTVAHDLRSPLGNISGYADLLRWDAALMTSTEVADLALEIHQQSRRLRSILDELLLLASVRKEDVKLGPLAMDEIVAESLERLTDIIVHSEAEIRTPPSWPGALGHGPWIEEVWVNYLSNALAYGGKPPVIEVGAEPWTDAMVRFWVRDNGPGIAPDAREHIFLPFTRLSQVNVSGHGLGLSIVLRIITKLGGEVGVESEPGQGSLFFFTLPAAANTPQ